MDRFIQFDEILKDLLLVYGPGLVNGFVGKNRIEDFVLTISEHNLLLELFRVINLRGIIGFTAEMEK